MWIVVSLSSAFLFLAARIPCILSWATSLEELVKGLAEELAEELDEELDEEIGSLVSDIDFAFFLYKKKKGKYS